MKPNYEIQQILYNWVRTLPIDDLTGESIVTHEHIDHLGLELSETIHDLGESRHNWRMLSRFITTHLRSNIVKLKERQVSRNLLHPLQAHPNNPFRAK